MRGGEYDEEEEERGDAPWTAYEATRACFWSARVCWTGAGAMVLVEVRGERRRDRQAEDDGRGESTRADDEAVIDGA